MLIPGALIVLLGLGGVPWLLSLALLPRWIRAARIRLPDQASGVQGGLGVVIPARDEQDTIEAAVAGARAIPGPRAIVVVDDGSADSTAERARTALAGDGVLLSAPPRPAQWSGKAWACTSGVQALPPCEWLLFVDADVWLDPRVVGALQRAADDGDADLISAFGTWRLPSLGALWLVPAMGWLVRGFVDPRAVRAGRQAFANGQVILVRTVAYERAGGHAAVRSDVLDDVALATAVQRSGGRLDVRWVPDGFQVQAYEGVLDMVAGYRKNLHAGLGRRRWLGLVLAGLVLWAWMGPLAACILSGLTEALGAAGHGFAVVSLSALLLARFVLERLDGRSGWIAVLQPFAGLPIAWTFVASALGGRATWKGRAFVDGRVPVADSGDADA